MIKAILFDLDGTLVNTNELILETFKYVFKNHLNMKVDDKEIVNTFGEPLMGVLERYGKDRAEELFQAYITYNEEVHDSLIKSIDGVEEGLKLLKETGLKIGIVTSKRRAAALRGLRLFDLEKFMDVIVTPEDTKIHKPHGEPVLKACELLGISPEYALMVGDSHNDILCGQNANAKTCLVKYTALSVEDILKHKPDYVVDSVIDIYNIVKDKKIC
ncbi:MAG: pyrophosphatase PpaX [Clostridiaceae bacterium]